VAIGCFVAVMHDGLGLRLFVQVLFACRFWAINAAYHDSLQQGQPLTDQSRLLNDVFAIVALILLFNHDGFTPQQAAKLSCDCT
jgi:hypothetical protein